ncbi:MAG: hypothetical protein HeimC3_49900 [Candidatus Heimdallarchaeota archaeon LC_3]|nr:MAG: hypothetical protein HeimC3_49900 [Candidatus Heimdallarchaeota archaeon LC_3]
MKMVGWEVDEELIRNALKKLENDRNIRWQKRESQKTGYVYYELRFPPYQVYEDEMGVEEFNETEFFSDLFWEEVERSLKKEERKNKKKKKK